MKKLALIKGAEEAPHSVTGGTDSGSGVVSMRTCWLNLREEISGENGGWEAGGNTEALDRTFSGDGGCPMGRCELATETKVRSKKEAQACRVL